MRPTIKLKLAGAFAAVLLICAALGVVGILKMNAINAQSTEITDNWMPSIDALHRINTATSDLRVGQYYHVASTDPAKMTEVETEINATLATLKQQRARYEKLISSDQERASYAQFSEKFDRYVREGNQILTLSRQNQNAEAARRIEQSKTLFDDFSGDLLKLVKLNVDGGAAASKTGDDVYDAARSLFIGLVVAALAIGIIAALWISRTVTLGLRKVATAIDAVAIGDLDQDVAVTSNDEIKDLVDTVNRMTANLRQT